MYIALQGATGSKPLQIPNRDQKMSRISIVPRGAASERDLGVVHNEADARDQNEVGDALFGGIQVTLSDAIAVVRLALSDEDDVRDLGIENHLAVAIDAMWFSGSIKEASWFTAT